MSRSGVFVVGFGDDGFDRVFVVRHVAEVVPLVTGQAVGFKSLAGDLIGATVPAPFGFAEQVADANLETAHSRRDPCPAFRRWGF